MHTIDKIMGLAEILRTAATRGQQDAARNELHAAIANATGVAKMTDTITLPRSVIERTLKCLNTPENQDLRLVSSALYAALAQQAEQAHTNVKSSAGLIRNGKVDDFMESYFPTAPKETK